MTGTVTQKHTPRSHRLRANLPRTIGVFLVAFLLCGVAFAHGTAARRAQGDLVDDIVRRIDVRDNASLFALFVLLNAAGYDDGADAPMHAVRRSVRSALPRQIPDTTFEKIEAYYTSHGTSTDLASYAIAAIATSGPPAFTRTFAWDDDVANRAALRAHAQLPALLQSFVRSIRFDSIYKAQQAAHLAYSVEYTPNIRREAAGVLRYARVASRAELYRVGERGRTIVIPSLLMARGASFSVQLDSMTFVVEGPQSMAALDPHEVIRAVTWRLTHDAKNAALHRKATAAFTAMKGMPAVAQRPALADFIDENLIRAIALRYREDRRESEPVRAATMEHVRSGFVLVPYFMEQLAKYESQTAPLRAYYARLFDQLDGARETARWRDSIAK